MNNLDEYIKSLKEYFKKNNIRLDDEIVRYVYLDLGNKLSFNVQFLPFGNSRKRGEIYKNGSSINELNDCFKNRTVICNSASNILALVLRSFGINIKTVVDGDNFKKCPHVYNVIVPTDKDPYIVDLQEDMYRIKMHGRTSNFGLSFKDLTTYVISYYEQEIIDRKIGYIDSLNYYTDDYIYTLKADVGLFDDFNEKVKFVLDNIDIIECPDMQYTDRQWYHVRLLEKIFDEDEFDYINNKGKIHFIDCYKDINGKRLYLSFIAVDNKNEPDIYFYNTKTLRYKRVEFDKFVQAVRNGLVLYKSKVKNLNKSLKKNDENYQKKIDFHQ